MIETFNIDPPPEETVKHLAFIASLGSHAYSNVSIRRQMDEAGVWSYDDDGKGKNSASMQFRRSVLEPLEEKGWIEKGGKNRWNITTSGKVIPDIFFDKDDLRTYEEIIMSLKEARYSVCRSVCDCIEIPFDLDRP